MSKQIKTHMGTISKERNKAILKHLSKPNPSELKGIPKEFRESRRESLKKLYTESPKHKSPKKSASMPKDLSGEKTRLWKEKKTYDKTKIVEPERYEKGAVERFRERRRETLKRERAMPEIRKKNQLIIESIRNKEAKEALRKEVMKKSLGKTTKKSFVKGLKMVGPKLLKAGGILAAPLEMLFMEGLSPNQAELVKQHNLKMERKEHFKQMVDRAVK